MEDINKDIKKGLYNHINYEKYNYNMFQLLAMIIYNHFCQITNQTISFFDNYCFLLKFNILSVIIHQSFISDIE